MIRWLRALAIGLAPLLGAPAVTAEPEAFRAVLDGRPRAVVAHLGAGYWLGYDAERCAPYKLWHGAVALRGAVYDTIHGPTPGSVGRTVWLEDARAPAGEGPEARFLGYRFEGDRVVFSCAFDEVPTDARAAAWDDAEGRVHFTWSLELASASGARRPAPAPTQRLVGYVFAERAAGEGIAPAGELALGWATLLRRDAEVAPGRPFHLVAESPLAPADGDGVAFQEAGGSRLANLETDPAIAVEHALGYLRYPLGGFGPPVEAIGPARTGFGPLDLRFRTGDDPVARPLLRGWLGEATENLQAGPVGMALRVGDEPVVVEALGRAVLAGNRGEVGVRLTEEDGRIVVEGTVDLAAGTPGEIAWAALDAPVTLLAGARYHLLTDQAFGGNVLFAPGLIGPGLATDEEAAAATRASTAILVDGAPVAVEPGAWLRVWEVPRPLRRASELLPGQLPNLSEVVPRPALPDGFAVPPPFVARLDQWITVPDGPPQRLSVFGGADTTLEVDGKRVEGAQVLLSPGRHEVSVRAVVLGTPPVLALRLDERPLEPARVATRTGVVRITAPGTKGVTPLELRWDGFEPMDAVILGYLAGQDLVSWFTRTVLGRPTDDGRSVVYSVGDALPGVHPSFTLETIRPEAFQPKVGGLAFLSDGRLAVACWEPEGGVYLLDNVLRGSQEPVRVTRVAHGLLEPLGLAAVDDELYVIQKPELTHLVDRDGDGVTDEYRTLSQGWGVTQNFHEFAFGLAYHRGRFHGTLATAINPGGPSAPNQHLHRGRVFSVAREGGDLRFEAAGLRTPNGIGLGPDDALYVADNQGDWLPASKIVRVTEGAFFGNRSVDPEGTRGLEDTPPVLWLPQFEIGNSPSEVTTFRGPPFEGQLVWGDVTHGGLKRGFLETVRGVTQGAVFRFSQGFEGGVNRLVWGPDGSLYVGGVGSTGNWNQFGKVWYGLQRLDYTGAPSFEPRAVRVRHDGLEVELTRALARDARLDADGIEVVQWRYLPTPGYGGPKVDERALPVHAATLSEDGRRVRLRVGGLAEGHVVYLRLPEEWTSVDDLPLWTREAWYTLNRLPSAP